jgi:hypothetical protein
VVLDAVEHDGEGLDRRTPAVPAVLVGADVGAASRHAATIGPLWGFAHWPGRGGAAAPSSRTPGGNSRLRSRRRFALRRCRASTCCRRCRKSRIETRRRGQPYIHLDVAPHAPTSEQPTADGSCRVLAASNAIFTARLSVKHRQEGRGILAYDHHTRDGGHPAAINMRQTCSLPIAVPFRVRKPMKSRSAAIRSCVRPAAAICFVAWTIAGFVSV